MSTKLSFLPSAVGGDRPLFYVVVCERADDTAGLPADTVGDSRVGDGLNGWGVAVEDDGVHEMARDALEAVWQDVLASPEGEFRRSEVVVRVCLPDGTPLGDRSD